MRRFADGQLLGLGRDGHGDMPVPEGDIVGYVRADLVQIARLLLDADVSVEGGDPVRARSSAG